MTVYYVIRHGRRIAVETIDTGITRKSRAARSKGRFVMLPMAWVSKLAEINASGTTYRVAIHLLLQTWQRKAPTIKHRAGLISVERRPAKSPMITVLMAD